MLLFPLVALLATLPLILNGSSCGHDFDFHVVSWMEAATQFRQGNLHPHWAFTAAFNAGEPRFVFYPPLSWTIGALLGLLLPWTAAPIVYTWLVLTAAGLACYRLLRSFTAPRTALFVAAIYAVNPYMLFTAYERTAYAELLAAVWLPLLLHAILRERVHALGIAIPVALLWLTNPPAAVLGCYSLAFLTAARLTLTLLKPQGATISPAQLARSSIFGAALGLGLASFYLVPAAFERRDVDVAMASAQSMLIGDNFLFHHTSDPDHDAVLRTASFLALGLLLATGVSLLIGFYRSSSKGSGRGILYVLAALAATIALLLTSASAPVWHHAPVLAFLQFPWRFLAMLTPALALSLAFALRDTHLTPARAASASLLLAGVFTLAGYRAFAQSCDPQETVAGQLSLFRAHRGSDATDEYTPNGASNENLSNHTPPFWLAPDPGAPAPATAQAGPLRWPVDITSPVPQTLILNLRNYSAWRITLNHQLITIRLGRDDGLIAIPIPAGLSRLDIAYARSEDQIVGQAISAAALVIFLIVRRRHRPLSRPPSSVRA